MCVLCIVAVTISVVLPKGAPVRGGAIAPSSSPWVPRGSPADCLYPLNHTKKNIAFFSLLALFCVTFFLFFENLVVLV